MTKVDHYGEAIITAQKKAGAYGSQFSYEEYQFLHSCETIEEFQAWLTSTDFSDSVVFTEIKATYEYLVCSHALATITKHSRFHRGLKYALFASILDSPFVLLLFFNECHQIRVLKSKQNSLLKQYQQVKMTVAAGG